MTTAGMQVRGRPWLQTHRGFAWVADAPEDYPYSIREIAHALSNLCRFAGHTKRFYSVAQHSVMVAEEVEQRGGGDRLVRSALLHDAAEAFWVDLPHPIKSLPELAGYREGIKRCERAIEQHFGLIFDEPIIKQADLILLATEKRDLMIDGPHSNEWAPLPPPRTDHIVPWKPHDAVWSFLHLWQAHGGELPDRGDPPTELPTDRQVKP